MGIVSQRDLTRVLMKELTDEIAKLEGKAAPAETRTKSEGALPFYSMRQFVVVRNDLQNAGKAANEIKKMMKDAGIDNKLVRRVAVAAYELEINVCIHSLGGTITFITPEAYPHCLWPGKVLPIMEGSRVVGQATVITVLNPLLLRNS